MHAVCRYLLQATRLDQGARSHQTHVDQRSGRQAGRHEGPTVDVNSLCYSSISEIAILLHTVACEKSFISVPPSKQGRHHDAQRTEQKPPRRFMNDDRRQTFANPISRGAGSRTSNHGFGTHTFLTTAWRAAAPSIPRAYLWGGCTWGSPPRRPPPLFGYPCLRNSHVRLPARRQSLGSTNACGRRGCDMAQASERSPARHGRFRRAMPGPSVREGKDRRSQDAVLIGVNCGGRLAGAFCVP